MKPQDLGRRDFHKLSLAALAGALSGAALQSCKSKEIHEYGEAVDAIAGDNPMMNEPHVCRGLNTCKGMAPGGDDACAGQGVCATATHHECRGHNTCKGQGGCGEIPGMNACAGKGACGVPLSDKAWGKARASFEAAMTTAGKPYGPAPAG